MTKEEIDLLTITHPPTFFDGWSNERFMYWLKLDKYGNLMEDYKKEDLDLMLSVLSPFPELDKYYDICLKLLIKMNRNESDY